MKRTSLLIGSTVAAILAMATSAHAQSFSVRAEGGAAFPLTKPQSDRFGVGGEAAIKPEITVQRYFGFGPSVQLMGFPSRLPGINDATAWNFGGFARVKRPFESDANLPLFPWVDANLGFVRTEALNRLGGSVGAGVAMPLDQNGQVLIGPFVRYDAVHQDDGHLNTNTNSAKSFVLGISAEFGAGAKKPEPFVPPPPALETPKQPTPKTETPPPQQIVIPLPLQLDAKIQFAWDSAVIRPSEDKTLNLLLEQFKSHLQDNTLIYVKVQGHASSEGQVEHNKQLAQHRAESVMNWLADHGIPREKMSAQGFGSDVPVADNKTEAGRVLNRRVEFKVVLNVTFEVEQE